MEQKTKEQIQKISMDFNNLEYIDKEKGIISVKIHEKINVIMNLENYPKAPKVKIPKELEKIVGKPKNFLETLYNWNKKDEPDAVKILIEFQNFIAMHGQGELLISRELMSGVLKWAKDYYPKEVLCLLRKEKGIISEMIYPPGFIGGDVSAIFSASRVPIDHSIVGSVHSHPSGVLFPSTADLAMFSRYPLNIIVGPPYHLSNINCFDREGKHLAYRLVAIDY